MSHRSAVKKPPKKVSDTNRDRRARRGEKQASPKSKTAAVPEPVAPPPMPVQDAALLPPFARELLPAPPEQVVLGPGPEADVSASTEFPPTDEAVDTLLEQLGRSAPLPNRVELPADHPAHRLSAAQWVRLQVTLEAMGRGENVWRAAREAVDNSDLLDRITRDILAFGEAPDLQRQTFGAPE